MAGQAEVKDANERFVIAIQKDGAVRRYNNKEEAPEGSAVFEQIDDLQKLPMADLDKIASKILKTPLTAAKNKEAAVDRAWTAMVAISAIPPAPEKKSAGRATRVSSTTFTLVYDFDSPSEADQERFKNLPPQAQTCLKIMARGGKQQYSEAELRKLVEENATDLKTVQDPWRIFQYYRNRLKDEKMIQAA